MILTKLNKDSSWLLESKEGKILIDPWFTESQIDLAPWFSEQYHTSAQPSAESIGAVDYIFISHPFTDHCNKETLLKFSSTIPVITTASIASKISKWNHFEKIVLLENAPFKIKRLSSGSLLDLVHDGFLFYIEEKIILYAPHGLKKYAVQDKVDLLISTTTRYHLPFWLGGTVNLGMESLEKLLQKTGSNVCLTTHDEKKIGKGMVEKLANKSYLSEYSDKRIVALGQGDKYELA